MTSIDIINFALSSCGVNLIASLEDDLPEARLAKAQYAAVKDAVLEDREWTFAKKRLQLVKDAAVPAFGYTYQFIIPSDIVRVVRVYNSSDDTTQVSDWVREGFRVLTNTDSPIYAEAIQRVDEGSFSPGMVLALAARLAGEWAIPLTENRQLAKDQMDKYDKLIVDAGAMDGSQGRTQVMRPPALRGRRQTL